MNKKYRDLDEALDILYDYKGGNPYILMIKRDVYIDKKSDSLGDFQIEYILKNKDREPIPINRITKIPEWYGENRKEAWNLNFTPNVLKIVSYLGETNKHYNCYVQYRRSVDPVMCFIPKSAVINNFLVDNNYSKMDINFDRYDNLSTSIDPNRKLKEHQKDAVKFLLNRKRCILADEQGLGKSLELSVAAIEGNFDSVLIVCPASLKNNWKNELLWYVSEKDITIIDGFQDKTKGELETFLGYSVGKSGKKREELLEEAKTNGKWQFNRFVIINYDILDEFFTFKRTISEEAKKAQIENSPILKYIYNRKSCIIVDEAHKLSNTSSTRYKVINNLIKKGNPECVFLATGTPITNNPLNLLCILLLIENEVSSDVDAYKSRYCDSKAFLMKGEYEKWKNVYYKQNNLSPSVKLSKGQYSAMRDFIWERGRKFTTAKGATNLDELKERISHIYLRRTKEDIGNLPQKNIHELYYNLTYKQKGEYEKLWDEYETAQREIDPDKELNEDLLSGAIYRKYLSNLMVNNTIKLCEKILKTENKIVIACCYDEELYTLRDYFGDSCVVFNGKCSLKQRDKAIDSFKNDDNVKIFLGNITAASVGLTLTCAKSLIFNNMSWVAADNKQMEDRIHRIGQTRDVDIYYQIYKDTQYEHMWDIVLKKQLIIDSVIINEKKKKV